jgi:hypothetical protein
MTDTAAGDNGQCQCPPCLARAQKRTVRAWGRISGLDLTKPPGPVLRWTLLLILGLSCWAVGIPLEIRDWLGPIILAGALILPDVAGFGIAGVRLDLKDAQDELAAIRQDVNAQARAAATATIVLGDSAISRLVQTYGRAVTQTASDQASGGAAPWQPPDGDTPAAEDVTL